MLAWMTVVVAVACDGATTVQQLVDGLVATETSLRTGATATHNSADLLDALKCLGEPLPAALAGRAYRAVAAGRLEDGDRAGAMAWLATAAEVDGGFAYGVEDVPAGHPLAVAWRVATGSPSVDPVVVGAMVPGRHLLDGRRMSRLEARPNRQHIYQTDASGQWVTTAIDGASFPAGSVGNGGTTAAVSAQPAGPVAVQRQRPKEKTPLLLTGGLLLAGAGALYGGSFATRSAFDDAMTTADASRLRTTTNGLVLGSAAVLAAGAGTLSWGVLLGDAPGLRFGTRF